MMRLTKLALATALAATGCLAVTAEPAQAQFFKGKTITIVIGYAPGGTMGVTTRTLAPFLARHTAGNPNVIVQSMPGGSGLRVLNWLADRAPKDGLTIMYGPTLSISQLLGEEGIRFDYKDFTLIGGVQTTPLITYIRKDAVPGGLKRSEDVMKARELKQAGLRPSGWYDLHTRMAIEMLGLNLRYVPGFRGGALIAQSVRSGESNIAGATLSGYQGSYEQTMGGPDGVVHPLWYFPFSDGKGGFTETASAGDIPTFQSVYRNIKGKEPSGELWDALNFLIDLRSSGSTDLMAGPPGMNREATQELRAAFERMLADPELHEQYRKILGGEIEAVERGRVEKALAGISAADPKMVKFIKDFAYKQSQ